MFMPTYIHCSVVLMFLPLFCTTCSVLVKLSTGTWPLLLLIVLLEYIEEYKQVYGMLLLKPIKTYHLISKANNMYTYI